MRNHYLINGHTPDATAWVLDTPNLLLLNAVMTQIIDHPELHEQRRWCTFDDYGCGTAYCFAGWTVKLAYPDALFGIGGNGLTYVRIDGANYNIWDVARELLGLTHYEADYLFAASRRVDEQQLAIKEWHANQRLLRFSDELNEHDEFVPVWGDRV